MRLSTIGIILLTAMVATKYFVSLNTLRAGDGSFKEGVAFDYTDAFDKMTQKNTAQPKNDLLVFNSSSHVNADEIKFQDGDKTNNTSFNSTNNTSDRIQSNTLPYTTSNIEEPLPMEHGVSLVVYDFSNPDNNIISSTYEDIEDDIPLDNGNTIINGLMQIMPRR